MRGRWVARSWNTIRASRDPDAGNRWAASRGSAVMAPCSRHRIATRGRPDAGQGLSEHNVLGPYGERKTRRIWGWDSASPIPIRRGRADTPVPLSRMQPAAHTCQYGRWRGHSFQAGCSPTRGQKAGGNLQPSDCKGTLDAGRSGSAQKLLHRLAAANRRDTASPRSPLPPVATRLGDTVSLGFRSPSGPAVNFCANPSSPRTLLPTCA